MASQVLVTQAPETADTIGPGVRPPRPRPGVVRRPRRRDRRHRRRRGQRPDRARRGDHGPARGERPVLARRPGPRRAEHARASRGAASATSRRTASATAWCCRSRSGRTCCSATRAAPPFVNGGFLDRGAIRDRTAPHRQRVRRAHARHRGAGVHALGRQPAEADRRARDDERSRRCSSPRTRPAASTSAPRRSIWDILRDARAAGLATLLVSADLEELIGLSDRLLVMLRGRIVAELDPAGVTPGRARLVHDRRAAAGVNRPPARPDPRPAARRRRRHRRLVDRPADRRREPGRRRSRRCGRRSTAPASIIAHRQPGRAVLRRRRRRRHRVQDEPVQHRRRRPVPARRAARRRRPVPRSRCGRRCTSRSCSSSPIGVGAAYAAIAGILKVLARRQRGDLDDHAQLHRDRHQRVPAVRAAAQRPERQPRRDHEVAARRRRTCRPQPARSRRRHPLPERRRRCAASCRSPSCSASATGCCSTAAGSASTCASRAPTRRPHATAGVNPKRMVLTTIILSGAIAGLIGLGPLLTEQFNYGDQFPKALGFTGIALALLGPQPPGRHRRRRARVGGDRAGDAAAVDDRHPAGDRRDPAGLVPARRRHRLRGRQALDRRRRGAGGGRADARRADGRAGDGARPVPAVT